MPSSTSFGGSDLNLGAINIYGALSSGAVKQPYSGTLYAYGGWGGYSWSATGLPPGLSIGPSGTISGTPSKSGGYAFEVKVTDALQSTAVADFTMWIGG